MRAVALLAFSIWTVMPAIAGDVDAAPPSGGSADTVDALDTVAAVGAGSLDGKTGFRINAPASSVGNGGYSVAVGDVNGDGFGDIVIGVSNADPNGRTNAGQVHVVFGKAGGFPSVLSLPPAAGKGFSISGAEANDILGNKVAVADVNGDKRADVIVTSYVSGGKGAAYVIYGRKTFENIDLATLDDSEGYAIRATNLVYGHLLALAAGFDFNKDGIGDIALGFPSDSPIGNTSAGLAFVVFGRPATKTNDLVLPLASAAEGVEVIGSVAVSYVGWSVSGGDVDGDGFGDLLVGAPGAAGGGSQRGVSYLLKGRATPAASYPDTALIAFRGVADTDQSGYSVSAAGDYNRDGFADLLIGAYNASGPRARTGAAYVVFGHANLNTGLALKSLTSATGFRVFGKAKGDWTGYSVASAGDVNADGVGDLIVGAPLASVQTNDFNGNSYVVYGHKGLGTDVDLAKLSKARGLTITGLRQDRNGSSVAGGDVNRDGFSDTVSGAPYRTVGTVKYAGGANVVFGRASGPINRVGTPGDDLMPGSPYADRLDGAAGNDLIGGFGGNDVLIGGPGRDGIRTGAGKDRVVYRTVSDSPTRATGDVVIDFDPVNDVIDLSPIDARPSAAGNQAFTFIGTKAFTGPGQLRWRKVDQAGTADDVTLVEANVISVAPPELVITLKGLKTLAVDDFVR